MLKLIVQHSPLLITFLLNLKLRLTKPQHRHVLRMTDSLIVSEARHKTIASLYRLIVDAPHASNGADNLRISPYTAEDFRSRQRQFVVKEMTEHAQKTGNWAVTVSIDDSLSAKDKNTPRHLEAVDFHHDHTKSGPRRQRYTNGVVHVEVRIQSDEFAYVFDWRLFLRERTVRRLNRTRPPAQRVRYRKKGSLAQEMLTALHQLLPAQFRVTVLFDSWYASNRFFKFCRHRNWHLICAIKSNRILDGIRLSQWNRQFKHQQYRRIRLTATGSQSQSYLLRTLRGKLNKLPFEVCVLISKRHHRDKHPKYFLCTDLTLSAQKALTCYQTRWPIEVDNFFVKQFLGLTDFRVQSFAATEKWFAIVFLAYIFLQWRLNHAPKEDGFASVADVIRRHRQEHARSLLQTACQEAVRLADVAPILQRFIH